MMARMGGAGMKWIGGEELVWSCGVLDSIECVAVGYREGGGLRLVRYVALRRFSALSKLGCGPSPIGVGLDWS